MRARPYAYHKDVIGLLIGEVYVNVSRHAPSGGKCEVPVLVKTHSLEITEVNDMGARHSGSLPGGHGLRQFAAEIEHIGGSLSTDCERTAYGCSTRAFRLTDGFPARRTG